MLYYTCSEIDNIIRSTFKITVNHTKAFIFLWFHVFHNIKIVRKKRISEMTLKEIKRISELSRPSFAFTPRVRWMWLVTTAAIFVFAMALDVFAKASKICESWRPWNGVDAENKRALRETKWQEKEKCTEGFYEAKLCAKWNRRKVTLRRSVRSTMQTATKDQNVDLAHWVVPDKAFSSYAKKLTFLRAGWERLPNNRKLNSDIEKYVKFVMYHAVIYKKTLQT